MTTKKILTSGFAIILNSRAIYTNNLDSVVIIVESGLESANSLGNYEYLAINQALQAINSSVNINSLTSFNPNLMIQTLTDLYPVHIIKNSYSIINTQNGTNAIIGSIKNSVDITHAIYYAGNVSSAQQIGSTILTFSIANGTDEIYNLYTYVLFAYFLQGARYAVMRSNSYNDIPNFKLQLFPTNCGEFLYDPT